jgi:hypothetical protein
LIKLSFTKFQDRNLKTFSETPVQSQKLNKHPLKQSPVPKLSEPPWILFKKEFASDALSSQLVIKPSLSHQLISKYKIPSQIYSLQWKMLLNLKIMKFTNKEVGFQV